MEVPTHFCKSLKSPLNSGLIRELLLVLYSSFHRSFSFSLSPLVAALSDFQDLKAFCHPPISLRYQILPFSLPNTFWNLIFFTVPSSHPGLQVAADRHSPDSVASPSSELLLVSRNRPGIQCKCMAVLSPTAVVLLVKQTWSRCSGELKSSSTSRSFSCTGFVIWSGMKLFLLCSPMAPEMLSLLNT